MPKKKPAKKPSKSKVNLKAKKGRRGSKKDKAPLQLQVSPKVMRSLGTLIFYLGAILIFLSFSRQGALLDAIYRLITALVGWGIIFVPALLVSAGSMLIKPNWRVSKPTLLAGGFMIAISSIGLTGAGSFGQEMWASLAILISGLGAFFLLLAGFMAGFMILFEISLGELFKYLGRLFSGLFRGRAAEADGIDDEPSIDWEKEKQKPGEEIPALNPAQAVAPTPALTKAPAVPAAKSIPSPTLTSPMTGASEKPWEYPPLSLLGNNTSKANRGDVKQNAQIIEDTLQSFGVQAKVADYNPGPAVTQFAIRLATGTKLTKVTSLSNDLALALAASTGQIRIEAPIPGRSLVGIELPNLSPALVSLKQLLQSPAMLNNKSKLAVPLGLDVSGQPIVVDIGKMPHALIAGATGSGKSVCINVFMMSLLFRASPTEVKFILVDPKRVELAGYNGIPHLLTPVIVEPDKVVSALKWVVAEMEHRYKLFAETGARDIKSYNDLAGFQAMPYMVIVIDELADIMLFAPAEVEECITKIAQKARAAGIHLILATQRPSVDVITGLIKANIPTRIAFNVSSMMDSRVILDTPGAEKLLGRGDMLYIPPDQPKPKRIQGGYVSDDEIRRLTEFLKAQGIPTHYTEEVTTKYTANKLGGMDGNGDDEVDPYFEQAVRMVCADGKASASLLQRKFSIGYNRAARLLDQLHAVGVVSAQDGAKPREVLVKGAEEFLALWKEKNGS